MGRRVLLARLDVLPRPAVLHDPLERGLEIARDRRIRMLVDRHAGGRMRDVDGYGRAALAGNRVAHVVRDVEDVAAARGANPYLSHSI